MMIDVTTSIPFGDIASALATAFEQGSGYWARLEIACAGEFPEGLDPGEWRDFRHAWAPLAHGSEVLVFDREDCDAGPWRLDRAAIKRGLELAIPVLGAGVGEYDACDADTFLQLCLFGEVVYA